MSFTAAMLIAATLLIVGFSLVDGEQGEENLSLERGFIPNPCLILLKEKPFV